VRAFTTKLRDNDIKPWVDTWEMCPGDGPIGKVFDTGIHAEQAILLSPVM
jgi:hypothetical protein